MRLSCLRGEKDRGNQSPVCFAGRATGEMPGATGRRGPRRYQELELRVYNKAFRGRSVTLPT
jgi:hypothetical protein